MNNLSLRVVEKRNSSFSDGRSKGWINLMEFDFFFTIEQQGSRARIPQSESQITLGQMAQCLDARVGETTKTPG